MLFWLGIRNVRRSFGKYLLAAGGICLAVLLVSSSLAGISLARRLGMKPIRQVIGGDLMVLAGDFELVARPDGGGWNFDEGALRLFDPAEVKVRLDGYRYTETLLAPAYFYGRKLTTPIMGRSLATDTGTMPSVSTGRMLTPGDGGLPVTQAGPSGYLGRVGERLRARIGLLGNQESIAGADLAAGNDCELELVGQSDGHIGSSMPIVPLDYIQRAAGTNRIIWLGIEVRNYAALPEQAARIRQLLPGYSVLTADQVMEMMDSSAAEIRRATTAIITLVLGLGCAAVLNTFLLLTQLRRREIAMMKVLGFTPAQIVVAFMIEGMLVNLAGALAGYVLGSSTPLLAGFGPALSLPTLAWILWLVAVVTLVSMSFPAIWSSRYSALEVMRNA